MKCTWLIVSDSAKQVSANREKPTDRFTRPRAKKTSNCSFICSKRPDLAETDLRVDVPNSCTESKSLNTVCLITNVIYIMPYNLHIIYDLQKHETSLYISIYTQKRTHSHICFFIFIYTLVCQVRHAVNHVCSRRSVGGGKRNAQTCNVCTERIIALCVCSKRAVLSALVADAILTQPGIMTACILCRIWKITRSMEAYMTAQTLE